MGLIQAGIAGKKMPMPVLVLHWMVFLMESMPMQSISLGRIPSSDTHIHWFGESRYGINGIFCTPFFHFLLSIIS